VYFIVHGPLLFLRKAGPTVALEKNEHDLRLAMPILNPEEEQRLARHYAGLSDGELEKIAAEKSSLTDAAAQALATEMNTRGLGGLLRTGQPEAEANPVGDHYGPVLVTIRQFRDLPEALLAKGVLDSGGVESFLADDNMVRMDWFISNLLGGVKLQVAPEDVVEATQLLETPIPSEFSVDGMGEFVQPTCPKCGSLEIAFEQLNKPVAYTSAWLGVPIPLQRNSWKCSDCGARWIDDEE